MSTQKKALITGSGGFVGPYVARELLTHGYEIAGIEHSTGAQGQAYPHFQADVTDYAELREAIHAIKPGYIFHLAGFSNPVAAEKNPEQAFLVNVTGTKNLLEAARTLERKPRVVVVSSSHVYGPPRYLPIDEQHPLDGEGVYAASRKEQERVVQEFVNAFPVIVTRSFNHTGPGQPDAFIVPKIIKHIVEIKKGVRNSLELGNIEVKRDISDVRDVARAYRLLAEQEHASLTVNVCRGRSIALKEVIKYGTVLAQLDQVKIETNSAFKRAGEALDIVGSAALLSRYINWNSEYSYETMIKDIYTYWDSIV